MTTSEARSDQGFSFDVVLVTHFPLSPSDDTVARRLLDSLA